MKSPDDGNFLKASPRRAIPRCNRNDHSPGAFSVRNAFVLRITSERHAPE
jgi:hypothetical protein